MPIREPQFPAHRSICTHCHFLFHSITLSRDIYMCTADVLSYVGPGGDLAVQIDDFLQDMDMNASLDELNTTTKLILQRIVKDGRFQTLVDRHLR